jgi:hypothetical protein
MGKYLTVKRRLTFGSYRSSIGIGYPRINKINIPAGGFGDAEQIPDAISIPIL